FSFSVTQLAFGSGINLPKATADSIHSPIKVSTLCKASARVFPSAMHPAYSGTSAKKELCSVLQ
ncbi:MAG: hypothetical protein ABI378_15240, partial [Chitinophagaceae bacterium]